MMALHQSKLICPYCMDELYEMGFEDHIQQCGPQNRIPCEICQHSISIRDYDGHVAEHLEKGESQIRKRPLSSSQQQERTSLSQLQQSRPSPPQQRQSLPTQPRQQQRNDREVNRMNEQQLYEYFTGLDIGEKKGFNQESLGELIEYQCTKAGEECQVCKEEVELQENMIVLPCAHKYHSVCIKKWLEQRKSCPVCMKEIKL